MWCDIPSNIWSLLRYSSLLCSSGRVERGGREGGRERERERERERPTLLILHFFYKLGMAIFGSIR